MTTWQIMIVCATAFLAVFLSVCVIGEAWKTVARIAQGRLD